MELPPDVVEGDERPEVIESSESVECCSVRLPTELDESRVTIIQDTREVRKVDFSPCRLVRRKLDTGDYSVGALSVAVETKWSLSDLLHCVGRDRKRFDAEMQRMLGYETRALLVASNWLEIERGDWRGKVTPAQVSGLLLGWVEAGIPVLLTGKVARTEVMLKRLLLMAARRSWRRLRSLAG